MHKGLLTQLGCLAVNTSFHQEGEDMAEEERAYFKNLLHSRLGLDNLMPSSNIREYQYHTVFDFSPES